MPQTPLINTYDIGDLIRLRVRFSDPTGIKDPATGLYPPVDPTTVVCRVKLRGEIAEVLPVDNPDPGIYEVDFAPEDAGVWYYRFEGSGNFTAAAESSLRVRASAFA